jgi:PAS domain S-box-containing protein
MLGEENFLLQLSGVAAWKYFADGRFDWSPAMYQMFQLEPGCTPSEVVSRYHPDDRNHVTRSLAKAFISDEPLSTYYRILLPNGDIRQIHSRVVSRLGDKGPEVVGVNIDVTSHWNDMKLDVNELRRFKFIAENTKDLIIRYSSDGLFTFVSPAVKSILGYDPDELIGKPIISLIDSEAHPRASRMLENITISKRTPGPTEVLTIRKDGSRIWLEGNPRPAHNVFGDLIEWVDVLRDVTERKDAERALVKALSEADAAAEAKSQFLANMSHELRTPLTSIIGFSDLIEKEDISSERVKSYTNKISMGSRTLLNVVNDILDLSKLENGALELDLRPFNPERLVEDAIALLVPQAEGKGLVVRGHFRPSLDDGTPDWLFGDDMRINQVLLNLLSNAIKFTDEGTIKVAVAAQRRDPGRALLTIQVADSGLGMSEAQISKLFERFSQADGSISRRYGGTGLGLAISRRLIDLMGGSITVESEVGRGSCFTVTVELDVTEPAEESVRAPAVSLAQPIRILLAEDNPANRELMDALLKDTGVTLSFAADGAEAVEMVTREAFDLVLMDIQMPVMDGVSATQAIRRLSGRAASIPIIALSANVLPGQVQQYAEQGFSGHVGKPINVGALFAAISGALEEAD